MDPEPFILCIVLVLCKNEKKKSKEKTGKAERFELFAAAFKHSLNEKAVSFPKAFD